jgi:hypothetical protein
VGDGRQWPVVAGQCTDGHHRRRAVAVGPASFEDDDIGVDDASIDAGSEGGADGVGGQAAMSEQHFDQSAGPGLITEPASRRRPGHSVETLVSTYVGALQGDDVAANKLIDASLATTRERIVDEPVKPSRALAAEMGKPGETGPLAVNRG